jgi:predicted MFS family arabinose efflux permease
MTPSTIRSVLTLALARVFVNMTRRFAFPFLPEISRNLGVSLVSVQSAISIQGGAGISSPLFGPLIERYGRKRMMLGAQAALCLICIPGLMAPHSFGIFYAVVILWGVAKWVFDPAVLAYVADRVSYQRRGLAMGTVELSWAASLAVVAPLTGYLLGLNGMWPVYAMLFIANLMGFALVALLVPADKPDRDGPARESLLTSWKFLFRYPTALAALAFTICLIVANEMILIVYGDWMESSFDLELAALGTVTIVIAVAEVFGEFLVMGVSDRVGKRRLALAGTLLASLGYFALTQLDFNLIAAQAGIFLVFVAIETAIVASIPLFSEVLPQARAVMMSANVAAHSVARFGGGVLGSQLYRLGDFRLTGLFAMGIGLLAFVIMWMFIADHDDSSATIAETQS